MSQIAHEYLTVAPPFDRYICVGRGYENAPPKEPARLEWTVSKRGKCNAISRLDVLGHDAFARAGLVACLCSCRMVASSPMAGLWARLHGATKPGL
jgi:hypothetical protein